MKILIAFASTHGCTEKCAKALASEINNDTLVVDLQSDPLPDLRDFDTIIVGGSIHAGRIQKEVTRFCADYHDTLLNKRLAFFLCCGDAERFEEQLAKVFPPKLLERAVAKGYFGYEIWLNKLNWLVRIIIKKLMRIKSSQSNILHDNISTFAELISRIQGK